MTFATGVAPNGSVGGGDGNGVKDDGWTVATPGASLLPPGAASENLGSASKYVANNYSSGFITTGNQGMYRDNQLTGFRCAYSTAGATELGWSDCGFVKIGTSYDNKELVIGNSSMDSGTTIASDTVVTAWGIGAGSGTAYTKYNASGTRADTSTPAGRIHTFGHTDANDHFVDRAYIGGAGGLALFDEDVAAGEAGWTTFTGATLSPDSTTPTLASLPTGGTAGQVGWIKCLVGTTTSYLPYWQ